MNDLKGYISEVVEDNLIKVVISNKVESSLKYKKIIFSLKEKDNHKYFQIENFTDEQVFHENIDIDNLNEKLYNTINKKYKQITAITSKYTYDIKISKKGKILFKKNKNNNKITINKDHNKKKNYILQEGMIIEPLIDIGIFTKEGKIINSKYDKYKQINKFIEIIDDEVKKGNYKDLTILDFGCGKSYLTFILYYYFTEIKKVKVKMIGLDLKEDVINSCNKVAKRYGYGNLSFEIGDINGFKYNDKVDMVITLHACDTATDYALYNAINWDAKMIFSVPCCQHEANGQIKTDSLSILTKYGIVKERVAALITDAIRANLLITKGYNTKLIEFIDMSSSPKNILIKASKDNISSEKKEKALKEVESIIKEFSINPKLYNLLKEDFKKRDD